MRDPTQPDAIWSLLDTLKPVERLQAVEIIKAQGRAGEPADLGTRILRAVLPSNGKTCRGREGIPAKQHCRAWSRHLYLNR